MGTIQNALDEDLIETQDPDVVPAPKSSAPLRVDSFGLTDRGKVRENNEDQFLIAVLQKGLQVISSSYPKPEVLCGGEQRHLFVVADGVGGNQGGEKASALAIGSIGTFLLETFDWFFHLKGKEDDSVLAEFQSALALANSRVRAEAAEHADLEGMGTTLTLAYSLDDMLFVAHAGDSRCYLFRNHLLHRLTRDHTLVEAMVQSGALRAEEAARHHWRHVITNVVGGDTPEIKAEVHKVQLEADDVVLLCSDGLTEMLPDAEIAQVLASESDPEKACKQLVARANVKGGKDNITIIIARYQSDADRDNLETRR